MAKGSYFQKHKEKLRESGEGEVMAKLPQIILTDEQRRPFEEGKVLLIDKPLHWTSFDVVRKIRNSIKIKKVGHAGTLDPLATGLLIICTGKFTKKINEFMAQRKEYTGSIILGAVTPTYDLESAPENEKLFAHLTEMNIQEAAQKFVGEIQQFPPIYSAIKKDGVALYELARRGTEVELKARPVTIYEIEITAIDLPNISFRAVCSTGTYIRSLAHDLGTALGCGGYLSSLRRTKIGDFDVNNAQTISEFILSC